MKKLSNLNEAQKLNKEEQKAISGGASIRCGCYTFYLDDANGGCLVPGVPGLGTVKLICGTYRCCF